MQKEIISIEGHQTSKVIAYVMAAFSLIFSAIGVIITIVAVFLPAEAKWPVLGMGIMYILFPLLYLVIGYIFMRIICWLYNLVAVKSGGIRFNFTESV